MATDAKDVEPRGSVPVPDPTVLTTQQLLREMATVRELLEGMVKASREIFETRLDGMDKAIELLQKSTDRMPSHVHEAVDRLQELHQEKFDSISVQFTERDTRTEQTSRDSKIAIDAALQAAKEAVGKTEISFTKQIDAIGESIRTMADGFNGKIDDLKQRLQAIESRSAGITDTRIETRKEAVDQRGFIIAAIAVAAAVAIAYFKH